MQQAVQTGKTDAGVNDNGLLDYFVSQNADVEVITEFETGDLPARHPPLDVRPVELPIGLENYRKLFTNQFFWNALSRTRSRSAIISTVPQLLHGARASRTCSTTGCAGAPSSGSRSSCPTRPSVAAATLVFAAALRPRLRHDQLGARRRSASARWTGRTASGPSQIAVSTIVTWRWTGYNALIYLAGDAGDPARPLRGRGDRRRQPLAAVPPRDDPGAARRRSCSRSWSRRSAPRSSSVSRCCYHNGLRRRRHVEPVPDARPADVPAGLGQRPARPGLGHRLDDVPDHRRLAVSHQRPARPRRRERHGSGRRRLTPHAAALAVAAAGR